jgi:hypothetical protein
MESVFTTTLLLFIGPVVSPPILSPCACPESVNHPLTLRQVILGNPALPYQLLVEQPDHRVGDPGFFLRVALHRPLRFLSIVFASVGFVSTSAPPLCAAGDVFPDSL